jgi:triosephosphate isomerase
LYRLEPPILAVNFKNYDAAIGKKALQLAKDAEVVAEETGVTVVVAPSTPTLLYVTANCRLPVFAQHCDPGLGEMSTGFLPVRTLLDDGVVGSMVNHSEHKLQRDLVGKAVDELKHWGLASLVCAATPEEAASLAAFSPDIIALEPPELIGTGRAVSKVSPEIVINGVKSVEKVDPRMTVLCGAGITTTEDVVSAVGLGVKGVLVASAIVKATDSRQKMLQMADSLRRASRV